MTSGSGQVVGQVVALAFLARLWQGAPGQAQVPRGTAVYLALFALLNLLAHAGVLPAASLAFEADLVTQQPWRLATGFFIADGLGTGFGLQLWFFTAYSSLLERRFFGRAPLRYVAKLGIGALLIIAQAWLLSSARPLCLSYAICFFHVARWSRADPHRRVEILSTLTVRAALVPWCLLALALPIFGAHTSLANLYGIGAALALDAASALPFIGGDKSPGGRAASGHENRNGAGGGVGVGRGGHQKGKGGKEKKGAGANRERWTRIAQVSAAVVVVAYHSGARLAELRAGRRAEAAMSRQIAAVMDADAPNVAALLGKFGETRPLTADAASMLSLWTYATEHWNQALALPAAAINVNNLSAADGETLRQVAPDTIMSGHAHRATPWPRPLPSAKRHAARRSHRTRARPCRWWRRRCLAPRSPRRWPTWTSSPRSSSSSDTRASSSCRTRRSTSPAQSRSSGRGARARSPRGGSSSTWCTMATSRSKGRSIRPSRSSPRYTRRAARSAEIRHQTTGASRLHLIPAAAPGR